jgi:transposase-like protein
MIHIQALIDNAKCYQTVRDLRWPNGTTCPHCHNQRVVSKGRDDMQKDRFLALHQHITGLSRRRYQCKTCQKRFDDLTNTIFAGHHQPLQTWILCLYFMGLNLSNQQIALELGLNKNVVQAILAHKTAPVLTPTQHLLDPNHAPSGRIASGLGRWQAVRADHPTSRRHHSSRT